MEALQRRKKKAPVLRKNYSFSINVVGRVCINLYRVVESEKKLSCYSIEHVSWSLFNQQIPEFTDRYLFEMCPGNLSFVMHYTRTRVKLLTDILDKLNAIGGLIEKSKLYGCNFASMVSHP